MNNFGVIEVATERRTEAKLRKELELLDRDGGVGAAGARDAVIPIPAKAAKSQHKHTPNVRRILASQKTFANHLDDFHALQALGHGGPGNESTGGGGGGGGAPPASDAGGASHSHSSNSRGASTGHRRPTKKELAKQRAAAAAAARSASVATSGADTPMPDAAPADGDCRTGGGATKANDKEDGTSSASTLLRPYTGPRPPAHPRDADPLLVSRMPPLLTDDELRALLAAPPLTYAEARAKWPAPDQPDASFGGGRYPVRVFCEICGYWGRVRCTKCGTPVCALDCLEVHREDCITRYGL
ncbi:hit finger domain protein [Niveomyces insectorum RCEF 264]|uniref:Hit finger domain protein n=1 Tax=Niveomyces insectorum RCEF 264 TaxID=1081102 RepID=A0A167VHD3_9HYPO|nr:hit finger domain protein [Niveomyces insectorum RCEF 264]